MSTVLERYYAAQGAANVAAGLSPGYPYHDHAAHDEHAEAITRHYLTTVTEPTLLDVADQESHGQAEHEFSFRVTWSWQLSAVCACSWEADEGRWILGTCDDTDLTRLHKEYLAHVAAVGRDKTEHEPDLLDLLTD